MRRRGSRWQRPFPSHGMPGRNEGLSPDVPQEPEGSERRQRRLRLRRRGRRAYIRSVYFLPSLATLGNAVCGFAAMCVAAMVSSATAPGHAAIR